MAMPASAQLVRKRKHAVLRPVRPHEPSVEHIVTEDDTPVDNIYSAKQQKLLTEVLTSSWDGPGLGQSFLTAANVGLFNKPTDAAIVPDVILAHGVPPLGTPKKKRNRAYYFWVVGKPPDVAIEIVSNKKGGELDEKLDKYAFLRIPYYVVWDPFDLLKVHGLRIYTLSGGSYSTLAATFLPDIGLGFKRWTGDFDGWNVEWLRWCDRNGKLLLTGAEQRMRAERERRRTKQQRRELEMKTKEADAQRKRAEKLAAKLKALGVDPDS